MQAWQDCGVGGEILLLLDGLFLLDDHAIGTEGCFDLVQLLPLFQWGELLPKKPPPAILPSQSGAAPADGFLIGFRFEKSHPAAHQ